jgi:Lrp/AsnC family transcriptional regulator, leucine-responsive regulatory protein
MIQLDDQDRAIVRELQQDCRQTYADIAHKVGLSAATVHARVKNLEKRGVIVGYGARLSAPSVGLSTLAFVQIRLENNTNGFAIAPNFIQFPEIEDCYSVAGDVDMIIKVRAANPHELELLLYRLKQVEGVVRTNTLVTLSTLFEHQPLSPAE